MGALILLNNSNVDATVTFIEKFIEKAPHIQFTNYV